ncbi:MAG: FHA domain-containing protein [Thermoproteus sp. AZ2]|uniref:FHA domain-containing protein n=1 Tax=Thermoproteus sp. AZ2 TaxID=1609232 RepID=A0ACC6V2P0_9CREN|nr:MAG: signal peptide protein [Thermoproteus sp. AZ2]
MPWKCPICGTENPDDVDICRICGSYRPTARTISVSQIKQRAQYILIVEVLDSPVELLKGMRKSIDVSATNGVVTIGRALDNDVVVPDPTVSRRHLRVSALDDGIYIEDLGSTNGTYLLPSGEKISSAKAGPEVAVKIGATTLRLYLRPKAGAASP